jgi:hypothetical protein
MKARWNLDVVRGLLLAFATYSLFQGIGAFRLGIQPYQAGQFWISLGIVALFAFIFWALLFPSRDRMRGVFIVLAAGVLFSLAGVFWRMRAFPGFSLPLPIAYLFIRGVVLNSAAAVAAWFLYRAESGARL